jgi:hypothetical protein
VWVSVPVKTATNANYQDQEREFAGLPDMLGARSAAVAVGDVPG